jgi:hypothetical protein
VRSLPQTVQVRGKLISARLARKEVRRIDIPEPRGFGYGAILTRRFSVKRRNITASGLGECQSRLGKIELQVVLGALGAGELQLRRDQLTLQMYDPLLQSSVHPSRLAD